MATKFQNSNKGMSLVEVMIVLVVMSLIGLGTTTLIKNMFDLQKVQESKNSLRQLSVNLQDVIKNDIHWNASVAHASNTNSRFTCLRDSTPDCNTGGSSTNPNIYLTSGAYYLAAQGTRGFTETGTACNTYPSTTCPIRFNLEVETECTNGEANCPRPQVIVTGNIVVAPAAINDSPALRKIDTRTAAQSGTLSFQIRRGERMRYEPLEIQYHFADGTGQSGGACNAGGIRNRPLNREVHDVGNNATLVPTTGFRLVAGTYECVINGQAYGATGGYSITLSGGGNSYPIGSGYSPVNASSSITGKVRFTITADTVFRLQHYCAASNSTFDMGIPAPNYAAGATFSTITCIRSL